jgi:hypothetical protein
VEHRNLGSRVGAFVDPVSHPYGAGPRIDSEEGAVLAAFELDPDVALGERGG